MLRYWPTHLVSEIRTHIRGAFLVLAASILVVTSILGPLGTPTAHAADAFGGASGLSSGYGSNTSTCAIETVGWVICPVMRSIAKLADYGFAFINQNFLRIEYNISNTDSGVYKAWELMRTVANASFVIAFMVIIYSQLTGRNSGGYNIKRMLPRLIIGAVLVNLSYYVCVIGIEVSNVLGDSVLAMMDGVTKNIGDAAMSLDSAKNGFDDSRLTDITSSVLTKSGTVWILLAPVAAVTVAVAVVCAAGLVLLIMRKVVVAMLVLVSPLVFVSYLLPNIERYFQQWLRLFFQLLLLYPIIAFLLGTGQIISATIINVDSGSDSNYSVQDDSYQGRNGGSGHVTTDLAAAGAAVLPLLGVWFLLKSLTSLVSNAGGKLADIRRGPSKAQDDKMKAKLDSKMNQKPVAGAGAGLPSFGGRRPAFSRLSRRHKATPGGSSLPRGGSAPSTPGRAGSGNTPASMLDSMLGMGKGDKVEANSEAAQKVGDINAQNAASAEAANLNAQVAAAVQGGGGGDDKKGKSAKDIFNNMNKTHESKDKQRSLGSAGPQPAGGGGQATPTAPSNDYRAPAIMQTNNQQAPQQQAGGATKIIAVPVQVDASSFLQNNSGAMPPQAAMQQPPTSDIERKAKARAQKYIFDAAAEVKAAEDKMDILNQKPDAKDEPPHTTPDSKDTH
jgi:hypothetical protein